MKYGNKLNKYKLIAEEQIELTIVPIRLNALEYLKQKWTIYSKHTLGPEICCKCFIQQLIERKLIDDHFKKCDIISITNEIKIRNQLPYNSYAETIFMMLNHFSLPIEEFNNVWIEVEKMIRGLLELLDGLVEEY